MPLGLVLEISSACNLNCAFCYQDPTSREMPILTTDQWRDLLRGAIPDAAPRWLTFTGGEPLLYPGLLELIEALHADFPRLPLGLASNGSLLDERNILSLIQAGIRYFDIPLHASDSILYHALTGQDAADRVRLAMAFIRQNHARLNVTFMLSAENTGQLVPVIEIASALGADSFSINRFIPTGRGRTNSTRFHLSPYALDQALRQADRAARMLKLPVITTIPVRDCRTPHSRYPSLHFSPCQCGRDKWLIDSQGRLRVCEQSPTVLGDLSRQPFSELISSPAVRDFLAQTPFPDCAERDCFSSCGGGCRWEA